MRIYIFIAVVTTLFLVGSFARFINNLPDPRAASEITILDTASDTLFHYKGELRAWEGECTFFYYIESNRKIEYRFCNAIVILKR